MRVLTPLFATAVAVSVVHYADNVVNYADYPSDGPIPDPGAGVILAAWLVFTVVGVAGYVLYRRGHEHRGALLLALYSGSGLIGLGHYSVPGAWDMPWWRHAHVVADILCGVAILAWALWATRTAAPSRLPSDAR